ncbi:thiosulfate oxidation carrier protein SoxY [Methyloraptor flagellatus]|jgi:sulfur-oxidizing protein SoxY|uniref:Thiosulfate oxidation carrier protein SoxY n=1 Tax=Methyloraptor flagellatus TaxID=3162530 RepID=A0AAU7X6P4_9HYPH
MMKSTLNRRALLARGGLLGLLTAIVSTVGPKLAFAAWNKAAFDGKTLADTYKELGATGVAESADIQILASDIAENGAVVPVQAVSKLPETTQISFLVEKNPNMLAALFDLGPDMLPDVTTRIKMGQTSNVVVLVKAGGKYYSAAKEIKVTLGGCGG